MAPRKSVVTIAAVVAFGSGRLAAQSVSGSVSLPDGATPVRGAIVVAIAAGNTEAGRALTNQRGSFTLRLSRPGDYALRVLRIGYRPMTGPTVHLAANAVDTVRIVFEAEAVVLSAVNVRDRETCRVDADTGFAVARVWEEARKAMLSTQLSPDDAPLVAEWIEYDRGLDSAGRTVREQRVRLERHPTTHAFKSRPAGELASKGYVIADNNGTTYYAPDAEVLLSDSFAATHCFHLESPPREAPNLIGVGFQPTRDRRDAHDIEGTLWLDRASAELRSLQFRYTNLPNAASAANAGGEVHFLRLIEGSWLVAQWNVRMPRTSAFDRSPDAGTRRVLMSSSSRALSGIQVTGGEVTRVTRHDSLVYKAVGPRVVLQVVARDSAIRASTASLTLEGTAYAAKADSSGRIQLGPVLGGRYHGRVSTSLMDSLGLPPIVAELGTRVDEHVDSLVLPTARQIVTAVCPRDSVRNGEGMLYGHVRDTRARPLEGAAVTATWQEDFQFVETGKGQSLSHHEQTLGALSDTTGYWRLCGVPNERLVVVRVATDSGTDVRRVRLETDHGFIPVDLVPHAEVAAANREAMAAAAGRSLPTGALVEIAVSELGGGGLSDATVELAVGGDKRTRAVTTGPTGRALVPDVPPGRLVVRAKHIGFAPGQFSVVVEPGRNTIPIVLSRNAPPRLDTVRVVGNQRLVGLGRHDEFETRRLNRQATVSITREDIVKRNPVDTWQMLTNLPSMRVVDSAGITAESTRSMNPRQGDLSVEPCYYLVMIDGLIMNPAGNNRAFDLRQLPKPDEIHGIEIFAGPASIPPQYGGTGSGKWCGMIAVWTR